MHDTKWTASGLILVLALALAVGVRAQQPYHRGGMATPQEQDTEETREIPGQTPMMESMQGMMESMQGMMESMQGMMEPMQGMMGQMQGMMGRQMMGRGGMAAGEDVDWEEDPFWGGMMGHRGSTGRGLGHHRGGFRRKMERMVQQLDLSDEQQTKLRTLIRTHVKGAIRTWADIRVERIDLRELVDAEPVDLTRVKALLGSIASKQADLRLAHITLRQDIKKLLTPEQQKKFRTMRGHMMGHWGGMGQGRMMGPGGMRERGGMRNPCGVMGGRTTNP